MFSPVPSSRQPGLLLASLSRRSSSSVGTHCHHYTTGATLSQNSFSYKSIFYIQVHRIKSFLLSFSALSSPAPPIAIGSFSSHRSSYDKSCETLLCKLFSGNFSVGTFQFQFQSLFSCFQISRMGVESSSLLSGVIIDSSPILTTQDWSLHHAQVSAPVKYQLNFCPLNGFFVIFSSAEEGG